MNLFDSDIFQNVELTASINRAQYKPRKLAELGLFEEAGIATTNVVVEREGQSLDLVPAKERGAPGEVVRADKREGVRFAATHLPTVATILADEVTNVRAYGSADEHQALDVVVNERLAKMARRLDTTNEWQRLGAIRGKIMDADGVTVLVDLHAAFGIIPQTLSFDLDSTATNVRMKCLDTIEMIEDALGEVLFDGVSVLCGQTFWRKLISHPSVEEAFRYQESQRLRADGREDLFFGDITFTRYRGGAGPTPFVPKAAAFALPRGVDGMFISRYAPADTVDAANTLGLPMYSSAEMLDHGKGVSLLAQSNPVHLNCRPEAVIELSVAG